MNTDAGQNSPSEQFSQQAKRNAGGILSDIWYFFRHQKKWWLAPIVLVILLFGLLVVLGGTGAAPLIYTLF